MIKINNTGNYHKMKKKKKKNLDMVNNWQFT